MIILYAEYISFFTSRALFILYVCACCTYKTKFQKIISREIEFRSRLDWSIWLTATNPRKKETKLLRNPTLSLGLVRKNGNTLKLASWNVTYTSAIVERSRMIYDEKHQFYDKLSEIFRKAPAS